MSPWHILLSLTFGYTQAKVTCDMLANMATPNYEDMVGNWSVVFAYAELYHVYDCRNVVMSPITARDIEVWKNVTNDFESIPIVWEKLKLRVHIYKGSTLHQEFALEETTRPGHMRALRLPDYFNNRMIDAMIGNHSLQFNEVEGYLIGMSCVYLDVTMHSKGALPHASVVELAAEKMKFYTMGRPVCVPGSVEAAGRNSTKSPRGEDTVPQVVHVEEL